MSLELRAVIHFLWLKHVLNQAILSEFEEVYGKDVISLQDVEKWMAVFDSEHIEFADLPRPGRLCDATDVDAVRVLIESEGYLSQKKIGRMMGIHHQTVKCISRDDLNMLKLNFKWVPHALDSSQKAVWVQVSRKLRDFLESHTDRSLSNVYAGDEIWLYLDSPWMSMWIETDATRPIRVRCTVAPKKRMFCIELSRRGIGAGVMLPAAQSFNKDFVAGTVLSSIVDDKALSRPKLKVSGSFPHLDNAQPHLTPDKYDKLRIKRLPHPPYSAELARTERSGGRNSDVDRT
jgi:hypothetical protein